MDRTMGSKARCRRMSCSTSTPGAISISSSPSGVSANTHRSVTYSTGFPAAAAYWPLNVRCSTSSRNFAVTMPCAITMRPSATCTRLGTTKLPTNTSRRALCLGHSQECDIQAATVIEIELRGLVQDRMCVDRGSEIQPTDRHPTHRAGLGGQRDIVQDVLFRRHVRDTLGHADTQIHYTCLL